MARPWSDDEVATLRRMRADGRTYAEIGAALGRSRKSVEQAAARYNATAPVVPEPAVTESAAHPDERTVESPPAGRIVTLEELLALAQVDRATWEVERYVVNKWEVGAKLPDGTVAVEPLFQVKAWLRRARGASTLAALRDALLADIRAEREAPRPRARPTLVRPDDEPMLLEVSAFDAHFGKLAWGEETGQDYDVRLAAEAFADATTDLLERARGFSVASVLFPIGNDLLQTDNLAGTTTSGTPQDTDTRYVKAFRVARAALTEAIGRFRAVAPVKVIVVPGNHDRLTAFHMGEVLAAQYDGDGMVTVDNSPTLRKYVRWGTCLLGFTHGSEEKHADLPLIMAQERRAEWAETTWREWHIGHLHKSKETRFTAGDSFNGVRVRILPALCAADAWHASKGYVGEHRAAEAYLWGQRSGYVGQFTSTVRLDSAARAA